MITNYTAIDSKGNRSVDLLKKNEKKGGYALVALFAPEHGLNGLEKAGDAVRDELYEGLQVYSLHGVTRRLNDQMLKDVNVLVYDIQDIGSRSYTYVSTLFYAMEEAAKRGIGVVVLDRPNPLGGEMVDGPMLEEPWRSFVGYINVPYCHGLTVGELAEYFNREYRVNCDLKVVPMEGWKRGMTFRETGLMWIPTSPQVPEEMSPFYYPATGMLGELGLVNIGVGTALPFKVVGAPWIEADAFAEKLNGQGFLGVHFQPFHFRSVGGKSGEECHGVLIIIKDRKAFLPVTTQYLIMGTLKAMYPKEFQRGLRAAEKRVEMFNKVNGTAEIYRILKEEGVVTWKLRGVHQKEREGYLKRRRGYLNPNYS